MAVDTSGGTVFVGSKEKAKNGRGQNGDPNPSSWVGPRDKMPQMGGPTDNILDAVVSAGVRADNYQTRTIIAAPYPTHPNMRDRSTDAVEKVPSVTYRGNIARHPEVTISRHGKRSGRP